LGRAAPPWRPARAVRGGRHFCSISHALFQGYLSTWLLTGVGRNTHSACQTATGPTEMSGPSEKNGTPIVEHKPNEIEPSDLPLTLEWRIRQQEILAELGVSALRGASFSQLLDDTVR